MKTSIRLPGCVLLIATFLVLLFSAGTVFSNDGILGKGWFSFGDKDETNSLAQIDAVSSDAKGINVIFTLDGFSSENVDYDGSKYHQITIPEQGYLPRVGAPNLPVKRHMFAIPSAAVPKVVVQDVEYETFTGAQVEPVQPLLLETESLTDYAFEKDTNLYNTDAFFPESWAEVSAAGIFHGVRLGSVEVRPLRYNPVQGILQVARLIKLRIEFEAQDGANTLYYESSVIPAHLKNTLENMLLNYNSVEYQVISSGETDGGIDYLILVDHSLVNASSLTALANYHQSNGLNVSIVDVSNVGTTADQIKQYIQNVYNSTSPPSLDYVLLVADVSVIPFKTAAHMGYNSDIWYAWLDGTDIIADVGLGRLPATNETELNQMVDKTLNFPTECGSWKEQVALIANGELYPGKYTACKQSINNYTYVMPAPTFDLIFGGDPGANVTNVDITNAIEEGRLIINYRGHGYTDYWSAWNLLFQNYTTADVHALNNGDRTPVIFSIACLNLDMNSSLETLGEAFMRQDQGAVAFLGSIHSSLTIPNHDFDRFLFKGIWDHGIDRIGDLLNWSNAELLNLYGSGSSAEENITMYLWLGDPALSVTKCNQPPEARCKNVTVNADEDCQANASIDNGSFDPDPGDIITLTQNPSGPYSLGVTSVTLTVTDNYGATDVCTASVTVLDTTPPSMISPPDITVECSSANGTPVNLGLPTVSDNCDNDPGLTNDSPGLFMLGTTTITWIATDDSANSSTCTQTVTVEDTIPPTITNISASPNILQQSHHTMVPVTVTCESEDICDENSVCRIINVANNQSNDMLGDGQTTLYWGEITGDLTLNLRAQRTGREDRVYTITVECMDGSGNSSTATTEVIVTHSHGHGH